MNLGLFSDQRMTLFHILSFFGNGFLEFKKYAAFVVGRTDIDFNFTICAI